MVGVSLRGAVRAPQPWRREARAFWPLLALGALAAIAFWLSLRELAAYTFRDTPLGYTPLIPLIALALAVLLARRARPWDRGARVLGLDLPVAAVAMLLGLWIIAARPNSDTWYYWLNRTDMLALPLFATGGIALLWGIGGVIRLWPAIVLLLAAWPNPYFTVNREIGGFLADLSSAVAAFFNGLLGLPFQRLPGTNEFVGSAHGEELNVLVAQVCSGLTSVAGFATLGVPLAILMRGPWRARVLWVALGMALAVGFNMLRLTALFVGADLFGPTTALDVLHPTLGAILFIPNVLIMLLLMPLFRVRLWEFPPSGAPPAAPEPEQPRGSQEAPVIAETDPPPTIATPAFIPPAVLAMNLATPRTFQRLGSPGMRTLGDSLSRTPAPAEVAPRPHAPVRPGTDRFAWSLPQGHLGHALIGVVVVCAIVFAIFNARLSRFVWIGQGSGLPELQLAEITAVLPQVEGWTLAYELAIPRPDLFGSEGESHIFSYTTPIPEGGDSQVIVQFIAVPDLDALRAHTPQNCLLFHGTVVDGIEQATLGYGSRVALVHFQDRGIPGSMLFWTQPVNVEGERFHVRLVLFLDNDEPMPTVVPDGQTNLRANADATLLGLGRDILDGMISARAPATDVT